MNKYILRTMRILSPERPAKPLSVSISILSVRSPNRAFLDTGHSLISIRGWKKIGPAKYLKEIT